MKLKILFSSMIVLLCSIGCTITETRTETVTYKYDPQYCKVINTWCRDNLQYQPGMTMKDCMRFWGIDLTDCSENKANENTPNR